MTKKRMVLTFPTSRVAQPIAYHLVKDHGLVLNILRGNITPNEEGRLVIEISGTGKSIAAGTAYLERLGIQIEPLKHDITWHKNKCVHCTACVPSCPTGAIAVDRKEMEVSFIKDSCIACEMCIPVCPFKALESRF